MFMLFIFVRVCGLCKRERICADFFDCLFISVLSLEIQLSRGGGLEIQFSRVGGLRSHQEGRTEIPLTHLTLPHFCAWIYKDIFVYISIAVGDPVIIRGWMGLTPPYFYACPKPEPEFPSILLLIITALKKMFITKRNFIKHTTKQFCLDIVCWDDP